MRWAGNLACLRERRGEYGILVGKPEGKTGLGRPRLTLEDNIKFHLKEIGWKGVKCFDLAEDRDKGRALVNKVMDILVP